MTFPEWPVVLPTDEKLVCKAPPQGSLFIDNDALQKFSLIKKLDPAVDPLISSVVFAEFVGGRKVNGWRESAETMLRDHRIRIVPLEPEDALMFRELRIRMPPLSSLPSAPQQEKNEPVASFRHRLALRRLRFDLLTFAVALRHHRRLITNNHTEFQDFPFPHSWCTWDTYSQEQGWT